MTGTTDWQRDRSPAGDGRADHIEALLGSSNESARQTRAFFITFLAFSLYVGIIVWSTTDEMLLRVSPVKLPLLNVDLPIVGFYTFTPYLYLLFHFNLFIQLYLLSDKLHRLNAAIDALSDREARTHYATQVFPFAFGQLLSGHHHAPLPRAILAAMVWITVVWLPLWVLIALQIGFMPYHDAAILWGQRAAIGIDLLMLWVFWPMIQAPGSRGLRWLGRGTGLRALHSWAQKERNFFYVLLRHFGEHAEAHAGGREGVRGAVLAVGLMFATTLLTVGFSLFVAVLPDRAMERWVASMVPTSWLSVQPIHEGGRHYLWLTERLFDRVYEYDDRSEPKEDHFDKYITHDSPFHRNLQLRQRILVTNVIPPELEASLESEDEKAWKAALEKVRGLSLRGRDLRYADLSYSTLPEVDLTELDGNPARLEGAKLIGARCYGQAKMRGVRLEGANLSNAQLQGANLMSAQLQGANLSRAELQDANLSQAWSHGANLSVAQLQGANLSGAWLQGADLWSARLQGANLSGAWLKGADLSEAWLQGAEMEDVDLDLAQLASLHLGILTIRDYTAIETDVEILVADKGLANAILMRIMDRVGLSDSLGSARGSNILADASLRSRARLWAPCTGLEPAASSEGHAKALAELLADLACEDPWPARRIIDPFFVNRNFAIDQSLDNHLARSLLKRRADPQDCLGLAGLDDTDVQKLEHIAATGPAAP